MFSPSQQQNLATGSIRKWKKNKRSKIVIKTDRPVRKSALPKAVQHLEMLQMKNRLKKENLSESKTTKKRRMLEEQWNSVWSGPHKPLDGNKSQDKRKSKTNFLLLVQLQQD